MGIIYKVDKEKGITLAVWDGPVTEAELLDHLRRLVADPDWPAKKRLHLTDLRTTSAMNIDETTLKKVVAFVGKFPNKIAKMKMAMVADEAYQKSNIFQHLMSTFPLTVIAFNSLETACTWLGLNAQNTELALQQLRVRLRGGTDQPGKDSSG